MAAGVVTQEELELVKHNRDLRSEGLLMHLAYYAGKSGDWERFLEEFRKIDKLSVLGSITVRDSYNEVEAEDEGRSSIAQDILRKSTDFLRRILAPSGGAGECYPPVRVPSLSLLSA